MEDGLDNTAQEGLPEYSSGSGEDDAQDSGWEDIDGGAGSGSDGDQGGQEEAFGDDESGDSGEHESGRSDDVGGDTGEDDAESLEGTGSEGVESSDDVQQAQYEGVTPEAFQVAIDGLQEQVEIGNACSIVLCIAMFAVLGSNVLQTLLRKLERD